MKIRHGDLALTKVEELPSGLEEEKSKNLMVGSGGHSHSFDNGKMYLKKVNEFVFGYLVAKNTKLYHPEHGTKVPGSKFREVRIPNGVYELRRQMEYTNKGMKQVID